MSKSGDRKSPKPKRARKAGRSADDPRATAKEPLDGITAMSGTVTFGASHVSISVTVFPLGATATNLRAAGAPGTSVPINAPVRPASRLTHLPCRTDFVACASLPPAVTGQPYSVEVRFGSLGSRKACTVRAEWVNAPGAIPIILV